MISDATISADGRYRYDLTRDWGEEMGVAGVKTALWFMLNPSTADATTNDPTIRRVVNFSRDWGYTRAVVVNLYALRATKPKNVDRQIRADGPSSAVGPENDATIQRWLHERQAHLFLVAWGAGVSTLWGGLTRVREVQGLIREAGKITTCLGSTKGGSPRHPLYVRGDTQRELWP